MSVRPYCVDIYIPHRFTGERVLHAQHVVYSSSSEGAIHAARSLFYGEAQGATLYAHAIDYTGGANADQTTE